MPDAGTRRKMPRLQPADAILYRAERRAMLPFHKRIGALQGRMAFALARTNSGMSATRGQLEADLASIGASIATLLSEIEAAAPNSDVGPAQNCRRALEVLAGRLAATAP